MLSAALAASLVMFVVRDQDQFVDSELVSAHLRSLQSGRLIDVQSTSGAAGGRGSPSLR